MRTWNDGLSVFENLRRQRLCFKARHVLDRALKQLKPGLKAGMDFTQTLLDYLQYCDQHVSVPPAASPNGDNIQGVHDVFAHAYYFHHLNDGQDIYRSLYYKYHNNVTEIQPARADFLLLYAAYSFACLFGSRRHRGTKASRLELLKLVNGTLLQYPNRKSWPIWGVRYYILKLGWKGVEEFGVPGINVLAERGSACYR